MIDSSLAQLTSPLSSESKSSHITFLPRKKVKKKVEENRVTILGLRDLCCGVIIICFCRVTTRTTNKEEILRSETYSFLQGTGVCNLFFRHVRLLHETVFSVSLRRYVTFRFL